MALGHWASDYLGPKEAGGGGAFIVTFTADRDGMEIKGIASVDKTFQEVIDAIMSGKTVIAKFTNLPDNDHYINCTGFKANRAVFSWIPVTDTSIHVETIAYLSDGEATYAQHTVS